MMHSRYLGLLILLLIVRVPCLADPIKSQPRSRRIVLGVSFFVANTSALRKDLSDKCTSEFPSMAPVRGLDALTAPDHSKPVPDGIYMGDVSLAQNPIPSETSLKYFGRGLDSTWVAKLKSAQCTLALVFRLPISGSLQSLRKACTVVGDLVKAHQVVVCDENTREYFTPSAWSERRIETWGPDDSPRVSSHITIHQYAKGEFDRAITLGMDKFGLPDLVVEAFPRHWANSVGGLMELVTQLGVENGSLQSGTSKEVAIADVKNEWIRDRLAKSTLSGGTGKETIALQPGRRDDGDPSNDLVQIEFGSGPGTEIERQAKLLGSLFGGTGDSLKLAKPDDQELAAASARARAKLPEFATRFRAGLLPGARLVLKAAFRTPGGFSEYMWFEVHKWEGGNVSGTLLNRPERVSGMTVGSSVSVSADDVYDYIYSQPGQPEEGNETGAILERQSSGR